MKKLLISLILIVIVLSSCGNSPKISNSNIVGVWKYELNGEYREAITSYITDEHVYEDFYYEFYDDGTGCTYSSLSKNKETFTYEYTNDVITITTKNGSFDTKCKVTSNTLTIYEADTETVFFKIGG